MKEDKLEWGECLKNAVDVDAVWEGSSLIELSRELGRTGEAFLRLTARLKMLPVVACLAGLSSQPGASEIRGVSSPSSVSGRGIEGDLLLNRDGLLGGEIGTRVAEILLRRDAISESRRRDRAADGGRESKRTQECRLDGTKMGSSRSD